MSGILLLLLSLQSICFLSKVVVIPWRLSVWEIGSSDGSFFGFGLGSGAVSEGGSFAVDVARERVGGRLSIEGFL